MWKIVGATACLIALLAPTAMAGEWDTDSVETTIEELRATVSQTREAAMDAAHEAEKQGADAQKEADEDVREQKRGARTLEADARKQAADAVAEAQESAAQLVVLAEDLVITPVQQASQELIASLDQAPEESTPTPMAPQAEAAAPVSASYVTPLLWAAGAIATGGAMLFWMAGSSSASAAGASETLRRVLPGASPLFTRFEKDTVLGHPKREELYRLVMETPGITLQDLCTSTNLSRTAVAHHMRLMEQQHLMVSKRVGRSRHFYENGGRYGREQKDAYAVLRNDRTQDVANYIASNPGAIQKTICQALGIQASVAHWHVRRLAEAKLVEPVRQGRTVSYYLSGPLP